MPFADTLRDRDALPARVGFERLADALHPHRLSLVAASLAAFASGSFPLLAAAKGADELAAWHGLVFAASTPVVLWTLCLAVLATFFHPTRGLVGSRSHSWRRLPGWLRRLLRGYATLTVWCFALSPIPVLLAALV